MKTDINRMFYLAEALFPAFEIAHRDILGSRKGIYLPIHEVYHHDPKREIVGKVIGHLPVEKISEKKNYGEDKIRRMIENNEICSFQSEDVANGHYGGGIRATNYFLGPSGLPPHLDQKFAILLCLTAEELSVDEYLAIKKESYEKVNAWRLNNHEPIIPRSNY